MKRKAIDLHDKGKDKNKANGGEKLLVIQEGSKIRLISKETMDDVDILVSIHNSLVYLLFTLGSTQQDNKRS